jgi:hypothetical protein
MKGFRSLVALSGAMLTISLAAPARVDAAPPADEAPGKKKVAAPARVLRLEEMRVEGRVQKPQAMFLMPRASLDTGEPDRSESFLPKVSRAVAKPPF